jgi:glucosamine--fructose-6-phosphate aminotransferase (isomerizing)
MCGITAFLLSNKENKENNNRENWYCFNILVRSLKALQNRGYDSCGIIDSEFKCLLRTIKKSEMLLGEDKKSSLSCQNQTKFSEDAKIPEDAVEQLSLKQHLFPKNALVGMAHTRWATSGKKTVPNAHPHVSHDGKVAVIHNGIIENYVVLKENLIKDGWLFSSETDTEIISNWVAREIGSNVTEESVVKAIHSANKHLEGTWAITLMHKDLPESVFVARRGNPLLIGYNELSGNIMVSSEIAGFVNKVTKYGILGDGDVIHLKSGFMISDILKQSNEIKFQNVPTEIIKLTPGNFPYFMAKEIYDQVEAVYGPCEWGKHKDKNINDIPELKQLLPLKHKIESYGTSGFDLLLIGCGTSYNSGLSSRWFFDSLPFRTVRCVTASEFTVQDLPKGSNIPVIAVFISQSGETLDTYRALKTVKQANVQTIALVNVENSMIARECDYVIYLHAGREVGVASTKAYVTQIIGLYLLSLFFKSTTDTKIPDDLLLLSSQVKKTLNKYFPYVKEQCDSSTNDEVKFKYLFKCPEPFLNIINILDTINHGFILSTGTQRATSYEASLKIKEVGRVFIQGYPTASLKHGPFSLIEEGLPILFVLQEGEKDSLRRTNTAIEEVHLRGALIYVVTDIQEYKNEKVKETIIVPFNKTFSSILTIIPFQVLSYYMAGVRGLNCDCPVNLAKCVTTD